MKIGTKIYYDLKTGEEIVTLWERDSAYAQPTTIEDDIAMYSILSIRNRDSYDVLELEYGQYVQDFSICSVYRVNPETKKLEFSYPDLNQPNVEQPYQAPLSEQINTLKEQLLSADEKYKLIDKSSISLQLENEKLKQSQSEQDSLIMQLMLGGAV